MYHRLILIHDLITDTNREDSIVKYFIVLRGMKSKILAHIFREIMGRSASEVHCDCDARSPHAGIALVLISVALVLTS